MLLKDRVAIVTGAASARGIGRATAKLFAEQGANVVILDLDGEASRGAAADLGDGHLGLPGDVNDERSVEQAVAETVARFGRVDVLVNNAGVTQPVKFLEIDAEGYRRILDVNLRGTLLMSQAVVPHMTASGGCIVNMSSVSAQRGGGIFGGPHYSAAKAAVLGLTKAMARELGEARIRVNAIAPGLIETDITGDKLDDTRRRAIIDGIPLGRLGAPRDVAGAALYLASDLADYLTGVTIDVNGGMHIH